MAEGDEGVLVWGGEGEHVVAGLGVGGADEEGEGVEVRELPAVEEEEDGEGGEGVVG